MRTKSIFLAAVLLLSGGAARAQQAPWSLADCINYALEHNLTVQQSALKVEQQEVELSTAQGRRLPTVNASASESLSFGRGLTADNTYSNSNTTSTSFQLGGNMPIFQGFDINNGIKLSKLNLAAATADLEKARDDIRVSVAQAYVQILYNQELLTKRLGYEMSKADDDAIANQYYNHGYVFNRIIPVETNVVGDSVDLEIRIREGKQATLNKINIIGNEHVFEDVVRRELRTKPGDLFNKDALMRSLRDLASMGHFDPEQLTPDIKQDEADGTVDITYKLSSKSTDKLEFSMGYGPMGVTGRIAVQFNNFAIQNFFKKGSARNFFLPQGEGQSVELAAQTNGRYYQQYSLSFMDPWFGKKRPNQLSVSLFYSKQTDVNSNYYNSAYYNNYYNRLYGYGTSSNYYNYADYYDPDKYVQILGGSIGWGKRLRWPDDYFNFSAMLTFQRYNLKQWQYFIMTDGNCNNLNLTLSLTRNSSDQPFFPRKGSDLALSVSATPPFSLWDGKDYANLANNTSSATYLQEMKEKYRWIEYHKWKFRFKTYTALTKADKCPVLMTRTEFGLLGYYRKHKPSPFETFYMGGDGMSGYSYNYATETIGLRGYDNGALTPQGMEAYAYTRLSMELRYPLLLGNTSIYALGFLEGGNAWTSCSKFNPFDLKRSAGAGLRLFLPMIGMLGIDWAYGFDKILGSSRYSGSQFHFIIGQEF